MCPTHITGFHDVEFHLNHVCPLKESQHCKDNAKKLFSETE